MGDTSQMFDGLLGSWEIALRAGGKSPRTVQSYLESARVLHAWLEANGRPRRLDKVRRRDLQEWVVEMLETRSAATARVRYASVQQLFRWAVAEGEVGSDPFVGMSPPPIPERDVDVISEDQLEQLLKSVDGAGFTNRRDSAMFWLMLTTGVRAGELVGMELGSVDLDARTVSVIGKGNRERTVAFGDRTALALDRYLRERRKHTRHASSALWLGPKGPLSDSGLRQLVQRRGEAVGIDHLHPHRFRHTWAHRWKSKGGSDDGLMAAGGWRSAQMLHRYGRSAKAERSRAEAMRLGLEDVG